MTDRGTTLEQRERRPVTLSAARLRSAATLPGLCALHGRDATHRVTARFVSGPEPWSYVLLLVGGLPFVIMYLVLRRTLVAPAWPVCDACLGRMRTVGRVGWAMLAGGGVAFVGGLSAGIAGYPYAGGYTMFAGLGVLVISPIVLALRRDPILGLRIAIPKDGRSVVLRNPDPAFATAAVRKGRSGSPIKE